MNYLFFDTETTGLPRSYLPVTHPSQPYIVQLAAMLCDEGARVLGSFYWLIDNDVEIPVEASNVHGITRWMCTAAGHRPDFVLECFLHFYARADMLVAHNCKFDMAMVETAFARGVLPGMTWKPLDKPCFCTMEASAPLVNLPPTPKMLAAGFNKPKAPKLAECVRHFFGEELAGAHDAMVDVGACKRVFFHLKELEKNRAAIAALPFSPENPNG